MDMSPLLAPKPGPTPEQLAEIEKYRARVASAMASGLANATLLGKALAEAYPDGLPKPSEAE